MSKFIRLKEDLQTERTVSTTTAVALIWETCGT
jgi:hypothetical protein